MSTWDGFSPVRHDVAAAMLRVSDGQRLTWPQWAAYVWAETNIPTAPIAVWQPKNEPQQRGVSYRREPSGQVVNYYDPAEIADQSSPWTSAAGARMARWLELLEDDSWRYLAINASRGITTTEEGKAFFVDRLRALLAPKPAAPKPDLPAPPPPADPDDIDPFAENYRP